LTTRCIRCGSPTQGVAQYCEDCAKDVQPTTSLRPIVEPIASSLGVICAWCGSTVPGQGRYCPACGRVVDADVMAYAGFWMRFLASFIDGIILGIVQTMLIIAIGGGTTVLLVTLGGALAYNHAFWLTTGATPGKMAMGMKIIMANGEPITGAAAVLRHVGYLASGLTLGIGYLMIAFTPQKRGLHDYIAGTLVVRKG